MTLTAQWLVIASPLIMIAGRAPTDIGLSLVALLFIAHSAITKDGSWLRERWVQIALTLCAFMCARNLLLDDWASALGHSLAWLRFPMFAAALAYWILPDETVRRRLIYCFTGVLIFLLLDGFWQYHNRYDIFGRDWMPYPNNVRLTGPFSSPRLGISIAWVFLPVAMYWVSKTAHRIRSWHFAAAMAFYCGMLAIIFASGERMAFLFSALASLLAFAIIRPLRVPLLATGVVGAVVLGALTLYDPALIGRQMGQTGEEIGKFADGAYGKSFLEGWELALAHPLLGVGSKHYMTACENEIRPIDPEAFCGLHPHNFYLDWLAHFGFTGMALMFAIILCFFAKAFTNWRFVQNDAVLGALFIMLIIRFWPLASVTSQFTVWSGHPQWLIMGWFLAALAAAKKA